MWPLARTRLTPFTFNQVTFHSLDEVLWRRLAGAGHAVNPADGEWRENEGIQLLLWVVVALADPADRHERRHLGPELLGAHVVKVGPRGRRLHEGRPVGLAFGRASHRMVPIATPRSTITAAMTPNTVVLAIRGTRPPTTHTMKFGKMLQARVQSTSQPA